MNGYKAFYKGKTLEVYASSSYEAQQKAAAQFKAKKVWEVSVVLCELAGEQVVHSAAMFG
jgi:ABC-type thiamine transport system substrate-binding protein